jgi:RNase adaptor protein for sRNA GlmZ degradation
MNEFLENVTALVDRSMDKYLKRGFTSLMINFGCTGGQHRSVYSAEKLYGHLISKYGKGNVIIKLRHRELEMKSF